MQFIYDGGSMKCIYNGILLTMNDEFDEYERGAVIVDGNKIVAVGDESIVSKYEGAGDIDEKIDASGGVIMPGFINGHTHISMSVFRTLGEDMPDRLHKYLFPLEDNLVDAELVKVGARLSIAEMLMGGVTTFADMYYYEDEVARVVDNMGMRAILGETVLERIAPDTDKPYGGIDIAQELVSDWSHSELITPAIAPHATYTNDTKHLQKIAEIAQKSNIPIMIHIAEMTFETDKYKDEYNMSPVEYLDSIGFLSDRVIGAHLIYVDDKDIDILAKRGVGVIHNVAGNAKSGRAVSPVPSMLKKGVNVGLATDGPMSGNSMDVIGLLDQYTKIQKLNARDNSICSAKEAVHLGTLGGARAVHMGDEIGSLEVGKKADIIVVGTKNPNMQPIYDPYSAIVYGACPHDVTHSMINGRLLMVDRKLLHEDINEIYAELKQQQKRVKNFIAG